jgi:hypothetical protein
MNQNYAYPTLRLRAKVKILHAVVAREAFFADERHPE